MSRNNQQPITKEEVGSAKEPRTIEKTRSYFKKSPSWRFSRADLEHEEWTIQDSAEFIVEVDESIDPNGSKVVHKFSQSIDRQLWESLQQRERMTWAEIFAESGGRSRGTNSHNIPMNQLDKAAQKRAAELGIIEDGLFSLRLDGLHRVFGILDEERWCRQAG